MLCSIDDYFLADGTLAGGYALKDFKLKITRVFDVVTVLGELNPVLFDRGKRKIEISFNVQRVQATITDADIFILDHESTVPRTGDVKLFVSAGLFASAFNALVVNGRLLSNTLVNQTGSETEHSYRIMGSLLFAPNPTDKMLLETTDFMLMETTDKMLLE
jgi:hypothetical protein